MPHTVQFRPELIDEIITSGRLSSYNTVFAPTNDLELVGAYLWNSHVSATFYPLFGAAEIALRNSVDSALVTYLGRWWWKTSPRVLLKYKGYPHTRAPADVAALRSNLSKAYDKVVKEKSARYGSSVAPTHSEVIAKTDFSTWEYILSNDFKDNALIWPKLLGQVFRGPWGGRTPNVLLSNTRDNVKNVREYRNRLFHHEPSWKRSGVASVTDAVQYLHSRLHMITDLVGTIHPEKLQLLQKNGLIRAAQVASSEAELRRYQQLARQSRVKSGRQLAVVARDCARSSSAARIRVAGMGGRKFLLIPE